MFLRHVFMFLCLNTTFEVEFLISLLDIIIRNGYSHLVSREIVSSFVIGWLLVLRPIVSLETKAYRWSALRRGLSEGSQPVFKRVSEKTAENSERICRQARPRNESGTSRLAVFERSHWWGQGRTARLL